MRIINVEYKDDGKKLTTYLTSIFPNLNVNQIYKALRKKDIRINDVKINENIDVHYGDSIKVFITDDILEGTSNKKIEIQIVYEDDNIVVFNKPNNLEVEGINSLTSIKAPNYPFLSACHRIDRNTTGLVLFAKNKEALEILFNKFKNGEIEKHYIALSYGIPSAKTKDLYGYLFKDSKKSLVYISNEPKTGYVKIKTSYKVIDENKNKKISLLNVTLHTGKTHQIRAHLASCGLPIVGDGKYGSYEINKRFNVSTQLLASFSLKFNFTSESGIMDYLNGTEITLNKIPFTDYIKD